MIVRAVLAAVALVALAPASVCAMPAQDPTATPTPGLADPPAVAPAAGPPDPALDPARLGFRRFAGERHSELLLAQRTIDRDWGPSDDSLYVEVDVPGWKSEPLAATLSAVLPGAGQRYVGEGNGWVYAAIEIAGWGGWWWYRHEAGELNQQAEGVAGVPTEPASGWTYERWVAATQGNPADLAGLYAVDREAYLNAIGSDPRYAAGWSNEGTRTDFTGLLSNADSRLKTSRIYSTALWVNHLVSAAMALRAARFHNMPLSRNLGLRIDGRIHRGRPEMAVALRRRF